MLIYVLYRVHETAYGFGGASEKNVSPHQFSIAKYQSCVSPWQNFLRFCWSCLVGLTISRPLVLYRMRKKSELIFIILPIYEKTTSQHLTH